MSSRLLTGRGKVWPAITRALREGRGPAHIAVAYLSKGSARRLPLKPGSRLVVDASVASVQGGRTYPAELSKLRKRRDVRIFSSEHLHAKVFVTDRAALVGSANASDSSAQQLEEAVLVTTDRRAINATRRFVIGLCTNELGPEELARLQGLYKPPKLPKRGSAAGRRSREYGPRLRIEQLQSEDPPEGSEKIQAEGAKAAKKRMEAPRSHELDQFWNSGSVPHRFQDQIIQVVTGDDGSTYVLPLATVVGTRRWRRGRRSCTFVYLEIPSRRRVALHRMAKKIGYGGLKALKHQGWVSSEMRNRILEAMSG